VAKHQVRLAFVLLFSKSAESNAAERRGAMSLVLTFTGKWNKWCRVLRYRKGFGRIDSVRCGLWLARGSA